MARLDVYRMPAGNGPGYLLDVQSDVLDHIRTRVVIPLLPAQETPKGSRHLNPVFDILDVPHTLVPQAIGSIPKRELRTCVTSLHDHHDVIAGALDRILGV